MIIRVFDCLLLVYFQAIKELHDYQEENAQEVGMLVEERDLLIDTKMRLEACVKELEDQRNIRMEVQGNAQEEANLRNELGLN